MAASLEFGSSAHIGRHKGQAFITEDGGDCRVPVDRTTQMGACTEYRTPAVIWLRESLKSVRKFGGGVQLVPDSSGPFS